MGGGGRGSVCLYDEAGWGGVRGWGWEVGYVYGWADGLGIVGEDAKRIVGGDMGVVEGSLLGRWMSGWLASAG